MSSKYKRPVPPRDPATLKVTRGDVIAFSQFLAQDPDFCLRVLLTAQKAIHDENAAQGEAVSVPENTGLGSDAEVATQAPAELVGFLNERDKYLNEDEGRESVPTVTEAVPA